MAKHPMRMAERSKPKYAEDVKAGMARLKGVSEAKLERDDKRSAMSPLGGGRKKEQQL